MINKHIDSEKRNRLKCNCNFKKIFIQLGTIASGTMMLVSCDNLALTEIERNLDPTPKITNHPGYNTIGTIAQYVPRAEKGVGRVRLFNGNTAPCMTRSYFEGFDVGTRVRIKEYSAKNGGVFYVTSL